MQVEEEKQNQAAAEARREVVTTEAETAKQKQTIEAKAAAERAEIDAVARVVVAEKDADAEAKATERKAEGQANAAQKEAEGRAAARKLEAEAEAEAIRKTRDANADGIAAEGRAEAEAIRAKGLAEAEAEKAKAEALAANDRVNLEIALAEIQRDTTITVYTEMGKVMSNIGEKATFIDMGGSGKDGDLLSGVIGNVPEIFKKLDVKNSVLNGKPIFASVNELVSALKNEPAAIVGTLAAGKVVEAVAAPLDGVKSNSNYVIQPDGTIANSHGNISHAAQIEAEQLVEETLAKEFDLDVSEAVEVAEVICRLEDAGYDEHDALDLAAKTIDAIKKLHQNGEPVKPASIAKAVLEVDGEVTPEKVIDLVGGIAKKVAKKRRGA